MTLEQLTSADVVVVSNKDEDLVFRKLLHDAGLRWNDGEDYLSLSAYFYHDTPYYRVAARCCGNALTAEKYGYVVYPADLFINGGSLINEVFK